MAMMVGHCPAMLDLFQRIQTMAETRGSLLIQGESGSGKELVARALHAASRRRARPLISLNCATIPPSLIEAELFGDRAGSDHRRGLVEAADEGTLFLDEISALTLEAQARLLQLLQDDDTRTASRTGNGSNVDVRVIAATHRDLRPLVDAGRFLEPLYARLNATTLTVPPLRERGHDVVELANWLLRRICHKLSKPEMSLSETALAAIGRYDWPGNVRELENALERAVILCDATVIEADLLAIDATKARRPSQSYCGRPRDRDQSRGILRQVRARASGRTDRDGARQQARHQPKESLGTSPTPEYSAKAHRHPSTATRQRTLMRHGLISLFDSTI